MRICHVCHQNSVHGTTPQYPNCGHFGCPDCDFYPLQDGGDIDLTPTPSMRSFSMPRRVEEAGPAETMQTGFQRRPEPQKRPVKTSWVSPHREDKYGKASEWSNDPNLRQHHEIDNPTQRMEQWYSGQVWSGLQSERLKAGSPSNARQRASYSEQIDKTSNFLKTEPVTTANEDSTEAEQTSQLNESEEGVTATHVAQSITQFLRTLLRSMYGIMKMLLPTLEPPVPPGHTRIRWKCRCGQKLFDDFVENSPGSLDVLRARLQRLNTTEAPTQRHENSFQQRIQTIQQSLRIFGAWIKQGVVQALTTTNGGNGGLPLHTLSTQSQQNSTNEQEVLHLLMCIDTGEFSTQLYQSRLQRVTNDDELFRFLRDRCVKHRNYASWFTLRTIRSLSLTRFKVDANCYASIHHHDSVCAPNSKCVCLPPKDRVASKEYQCAPAPQVELDYSPAIGSRELTHYFQKSHSFGVS